MEKVSIQFVYEVFNDIANRVILRSSGEDEYESSMIRQYMAEKAKENKCCAFERDNVSDLIDKTDYKVDFLFDCGLHFVLLIGEEEEIDKLLDKTKFYAKTVYIKDSYTTWKVSRVGDNDYLVNDKYLALNTSGYKDAVCLYEGCNLLGLDERTEWEIKKSR